MRQDERLLLIPHRTPPLADSPIGWEYPALAVQPLTQAEMVRHTDLTNRAAFGLVQGCLALGAAPDPNAVGVTHARFFLDVPPES
jgi:hypothetical protein